MGQVGGFGDAGDGGVAAVLELGYQGERDDQQNS
jgi:hypothetical protein